MAEKGDSVPNQPPRYPVFADRISYHIRNGTRPTGTPNKPNTPWTPKTLAFQLGDMSARSIRNWQSGKNLPADLVSIERVFFGDNPAYDAARQELRAAHAQRALVDGNLRRVQRIVPPDLCVGREAETRCIIAALTKQARSVIVLGAPGIGKTTLTRQVMASQLMAEHFGEHRWLVELDTAIDAPRLCEAVVLAMDMDPLSQGFPDVLDQLGRYAPALLVLDNLETPWEADMAEVQTCLRQMIAVPGVSVLASMRGNVAPLLPDAVISVELQPLAADDAQWLFTRRAPRISVEDLRLKPLLEELGGVPLAIELVAYRAAPHDILEDLWDEWQERSIALAAHPDLPRGRLTSVVRSIDISLGSRRLREEGRRLFRLLGQLPNGIAWKDRLTLLGRAATEATRQLLSVGLAFSRAEGRLDLLPPIRAFARTYQEESIENIDWVAHYLGTAAEIFDCLNELEDDIAQGEARRSLLIEKDNIDAAFVSIANKVDAREENITTANINNTLLRLHVAFGSIQYALSCLVDDPVDRPVGSFCMLHASAHKVAAEIIQRNKLENAMAITDDRPSDHRIYTPRDVIMMLYRHVKGRSLNMTLTDDHLPHSATAKPGTSAAGIDHRQHPAPGKRR